MTQEQEHKVDDLIEGLSNACDDGMSMEKLLDNLQEWIDERKKESRYQ